MDIYFIIYIPFIFSAWFDFNQKTSLLKKKQILLFWVIIFTLFRGLRWQTGTDWNQFYNVYLNSSFDNMFSYVRYGTRIMDFGYMFINAIFNEFGIPYTFFLLITNLIIMLCYYDFSIRNTKLPILTMILFMTVGVPFPVRQSLALAISFWSYRFLSDEKWKQFFIVGFIAFFIHKASIIGFLAIGVPFLLKKFRVKWWVYAIAYISTFVIAVFLGEFIRDLTLILSDQSDYIGDYAEGYINRDKEGILSAESSEGYSYILFFIILLFVREYKNDLCKDTVRNYEIFFFMYAVSEMVFNIIRNISHGGFTEILHRSISTLDMLPLILPTFFAYLITRFKNKEVVFLVFAVYVAYKFYIQIFASRYAGAFIPYGSVLDFSTKGEPF